MAPGCPDSTGGCRPGARADPRWLHAAGRAQHSEERLRSGHRRASIDRRRRRAQRDVSGLRHERSAPGHPRHRLRHQCQHRARRGPARPVAPMGDFIIKSNDMLQVTIPPPAIVPLLVAPVPLIGTGLTVMINNQPVCLQGDELPPTLRVPLVYTAPPFVTPGMGTLTLILMPNNMSMRSTFGG